ncbi:unnamed protein product [Fusarium venenatum]|uniref:Uncharacterized protein n=1 Tax=Fusarium venenatum TaxID=56646 RepID=A0A2L2TYA2_9HYPO|nr:uncharacterized protein FVRRES_02397 [Fusarium venenatum]CEI65885.1 unnamed protein product [Fusarium venenatum]
MRRNDTEKTKCQRLRRKIEQSWYLEKYHYTLGPYKFGLPPPALVDGLVS